MSQLATQWGQPARESFRSWLHRLVRSFVLIRMLHDNSGSYAHRAQNDRPPWILLAHLEGGERVASLLRVATLLASVVGSVNFYLFDRLLYICARSLKHRLYSNRLCSINRRRRGRQ